MLNSIFDLKRFLKDLDYRILWIELVLFSVILAAFPYMWPLACLIFIVVSMVLVKPRGSLYTVYILSSGWAFMGTLGAYFIGGWGWGMGIGICVLFCSLSIHFRELTQPLYQETPDANRTATVDNFNWFVRRQNLN